MVKAILSRPRILRTGKPLTLAAIRQACPAVFAEGPSQDRGPRYRYVPTIEPLNALLDNGWGVYEASQQRSRSADKDPYTKHMLRIRKMADFDAPSYTEGVPEVILINAHDGTSAYHLKGGFYRYVCSNGLIVGRQYAGFVVRHTVGPQTSQEVLEAGEKIVVDSFPKLMDSIDRFKAVKMDVSASLRLANKALDLRYPQIAVRPFPASDLLTVRREEDRDPTLWNMLNRIQESIIYGGWQVRSASMGRNTHVRPIERVSAVASINEGLWDAAEEIAKEAEA